MNRLKRGRQSDKQSCFALLSCYNQPRYFSERNHPNQDPMRLLFLNHNLRERGTYFRAYAIGRELVAMGHDITLLTASPDHYFRANESFEGGVRIVETPSWNPFVNRDDGWGPIDTLYRVGRVLLQPYDLLYAFAHPPNVFLPAWFMKTWRSRPLVTDWCDLYGEGIFPQRESLRQWQKDEGFRLRLQRRAEKMEERLETRLPAMSDGVTVISTVLEEKARAFGLPEERILRYPCGANVRDFFPLEKSNCRKELDIKGPGPFLAYIANYNPDEIFLLDTLERVFQRYPQARLLSTAPPFSSTQVAARGLEKHLIQLGRQPFNRLKIVLGAADLLLLPLEDNLSNRARWPHKFGDYLACGRPIAGNFVGDVALYFPLPESNAAIGIAAPCVSDRYADAICYILSRPDRWDHMGANARAMAEEQLDWKRLAGPLESFLSCIIREYRTASARSISA